MKDNREIINIDDSVISKAILKNGITLQSVVCMEECSELVKEISKQIRGSGSHYYLLEEMADVAICLKQLQFMYNISDADLHKRVIQKLERLEGRL